MRIKLRHRNKHLLKSFLENGFHLWMLLIISNVLIFYTFSLHSFGAEPVKKEADISTTLQQVPQGKVVPTKPKGPVIDLTFTVPGIGSGGGTMNPLNKTRNLAVFLYAPDVNTYDNKIKPLYSIRTTAQFDDNSISPTYTAFIHKNLDLGDTVKKGKYQITFSTDLSMRKLVQDKKDAVGGKLFALSTNEKAVLPIQTVIMGDILPPKGGDNVMNLKDYYALTDCFAKNDDCVNQVDLNDDGVLDGVDYNIMMVGFRELHDLGFAVLQLPTPTPPKVKTLSQLSIVPHPSAKPTAIVRQDVKPVAKPSSKPEVKQSSGNPLGAIFMILFVLLLIGGGGAFFFLKMKKKSATPAPDTAEVPATEEQAPADASVASIAESSEIPVGTAPAASTAASIAESTEIPIESLNKSADPGTIDKTYHVKKKSTDEKGTWVNLTDDAGVIDGLLPTGEIEEGFEHLKGTMTEENGKKYLLISEILPAE